MIECPVCNGLTTIDHNCNACGFLLTDKGKVKDYLGPYAPYMESSSGQSCLHLLRCDHCGTDLRYSVPLRS